MIKFIFQPRQQKLDHNFKTFFINDWTLNSYNCYQLLNLQEGASIQEVKTAYRKLALRYHPDKSASKQDIEKFKLITEAYQIIKTKKSHTHVNYQRFCNNPSIDRLESIFHWHNPNQKKTFKGDWHRHAGYTERACSGIYKHVGKVWRHSATTLKNTASALVHSVITPYKQIPSNFGSQVHAPLLKKLHGAEIRLTNKTHLFLRAFHSTTMRASHPGYLIHNMLAVKLGKNKIKQTIKFKDEKKNADIIHMQEALANKVQQVYSWCQKNFKVADLLIFGKQEIPVVVHKIEPPRQVHRLLSASYGLYDNTPAAPFDYKIITHCMKYKRPMLHYAQDGKFGGFSHVERNTAYFAAIPQVMRWYNSRPYGAMNLDETETPNAHYYGKVATGDTLVDPTIRWRNRHPSCLA